MLIFTDHIINSPLQTDVIYLDISKAYDTVSHSILLTKLWSIGITGIPVQDLLAALLPTCFYYSDLLPVVSGKYILGPLLFLVYIILLYIYSLYIVYYYSIILVYSISLLI